MVASPGMDSDSEDYLEVLHSQCHFSSRVPFRSAGPFRRSCGPRVQGGNGGRTHGARLRVVTLWQHGREGPVEAIIRHLGYQVEAGLVLDIELRLAARVVVEHVLGAVGGDLLAAVAGEEVAPDGAVGVGLRRHPPRRGIPITTYSSYLEK